MILYDSRIYPQVVHCCSHPEYKVSDLIGFEPDLITDDLKLFTPRKACSILTLHDPIGLFISFYNPVLKPEKALYITSIWLNASLLF